MSVEPDEWGLVSITSEDHESQLVLISQLEAVAEAARRYVYENSSFFDKMVTALEALEQKETP